MADLPEEPRNTHEARQEGDADGEVRPERVAAMEKPRTLDEGQEGIEGIDHVVEDEEGQDGEGVLAHGS